MCLVGSFHLNHSCNLSIKITFRFPWDSWGKFLNFCFIKTRKNHFSSQAELRRRLRAGSGEETFENRWFNFFSLRWKLIRNLCTHLSNSILDHFQFRHRMKFTIETQSKPSIWEARTNTYWMFFRCNTFSVFGFCSFRALSPSPVENKKCWEYI